MILPVRGVDVARLVEGAPPGLVDLSVPAPGLAALRQELSLAVEYLKSIVAAVHNDQVAVLLAHQTGRAHELAIATARLSPLPLKLALAVEHRDGVVPLVRDVHLVSSIGRDAERPGRTAVPFAPLEELGEQLLFAGTADLHLVDTHPEVVLVAAIGDVGDATLREAHRLGIVEPRARLRATPDGVAPLVDSSARHRCKRHCLPPSSGRPVARIGHR